MGLSYKGGGADTLDKDLESCLGMHAGLIESLCTVYWMNAWPPH